MKTSDVFIMKRNRRWWQRQRVILILEHHVMFDADYAVYDCGVCVVFYLGIERNGCGHR